MLTQWAAKRLRRKFAELRATPGNASWGGDTEAEAFLRFCELEDLGVEAVRQMLIASDARGNVVKFRGSR